jgi:hypothetical protein
MEEIILVAKMEVVVVIGQSVHSVAAARVVMVVPVAMIQLIVFRVALPARASGTGSTVVLARGAVPVMTTPAIVVSKRRGREDSEQQDRCNA